MAHFNVLKVYVYLVNFYLPYMSHDYLTCHMTNSHMSHDSHLMSSGRGKVWELL